MRRQEQLLKVLQMPVDSPSRVRERLQRLRDICKQKFALDEPLVRSDCIYGYSDVFPSVLVKIRFNATVPVIIPLCVDPIEKKEIIQVLQSWLEEEM